MGSPALYAQSGCTDPQAENYEATADQNDGSCTYASTIYQPSFLATLPPTLNECSGLAYFNGQLWAHNDGGNEAALYQLDTLTGAVLRQVNINGATNTDWEDIAQSATHLFIGDIGNNLGNRTNLRVYRIAKADLINDVVSAEIITFSYADQTDFDAAPQANNYDAEALAFANDSLHLFTKNWLDKKTRHYVLPAKPGDYALSPRQSFDVNGLITAAAIYRDSVGMLLGYDLDNGAVFGWLLFDFPTGRPLAGNKRRLELGLVFTLSQAEALTFRDRTTGYLGSEQASVLDARLSVFSLQAFLESPVAVPLLAEVLPLQLRPNPTSELVYVPRPTADRTARLRVFTTSGQPYHSTTLRQRETGIDTRAWPAGLYYFLVDDTWGAWLVKN